MKRLYLMRHAKSSWDDPHLSDRDRPLASRGRRAASRVGRRLSGAGIDPEEVLCSTAARARQTLEPMLPFLDSHVTVRFEEQIYRADSDELLQRLREVSPTVGSVLLIGHNPGVQELAIALAGNGEPREMTARLAEKFPTAALANLVLTNNDWSSLGPGHARLERFLVPRELD